MLTGRFPDSRGRFGRFGGSYIPETLAVPLEELREAYFGLRGDSDFRNEFHKLLKDYVGRPTPLTLADRLTARLGGAKIYLKREDLAHTGAHKINNVVGQILLARRMGKTRIVAETGAGQHGVATAAAAAHFGLDCVVYMGSTDMQRQALNVQRMKLMGAQVIGVDSGTKTLKDAVNEAMRDWITHIRDTHYLLGSALGPHPYPMMVRDFQSIIGHEAKQQILEAEGRLPDHLVACVGGGSNAIGLFHSFLDDPSVKMTGIEAGGKGIETGDHAARFATGEHGVFHGSMTYLLQDENGQVLPTFSISAGLDYQAVGPEHAMLHEEGRVQYESATDDEALNAFQVLCQTEGILPALESSHAIAYVLREAPKMSRNQILIANLSGRGDKDLDTVLARLGRREGER